MDKQIYIKRVNKVMDYIYSNLNEDLSLSTLSDIGGISPYHFHRIIRAIIGMPIGKFVTMKRLDMSASLLKYSNRSIEEIANDIGYESSSSFDKAFKKRFNMSPLEYRKNSRMVNNESDNPTSLKNLEAELVKLPPQLLLYSKLYGNYATMGYAEARKALVEFIEANQIELTDNKSIGICYDDPKITSEDNCSYDICFAIKEPIKTHEPFGVLNFEGGEFAKFVHMGAYYNLEETYDYIYGKWLFESDYELRDAPTYDKYINSPDNTPEEELLTEIYIPIQ